MEHRIYRNVRQNQNYFFMSKKDPFLEFRTESPINLPLPLMTFENPFMRSHNKLIKKYTKQHKLHGHFASFSNCLNMCKATWKDLIDSLDSIYMKMMRLNKYGKQNITSEYIADSYFLVLSKYYAFIFLLKITTDRSLPFIKHFLKHKNQINTKSFDTHKKQIKEGELRQEVLDSLPTGYKTLIKSKMAWYDLLKKTRDSVIAHYSSHYYPNLSSNKTYQVWLQLTFSENSEPPINLPDPLSLVVGFEQSMKNLENILYKHLEKNNFEIN